MSLTELLIAHQSKYPDQDWLHHVPVLSVLQKLSRLARNQSNCPVEASRLQLTHASEREPGTQVTSTQTAINPKEQP